MQYLDLLTTKSVVSLEEYKGIIPSLTDLVLLYGISAGISLHLTRPLLSGIVEVKFQEPNRCYLILKISQKYALDWAAKRATEKAESAEAAEKRLKAALAAKRDPAVAQIEVDSIPISNDSEVVKHDDIQDSAMEEVKMSDQPSLPLESEVILIFFIPVTSSLLSEPLDTRIC